ncbi:DmsC/YnfH family molybdoenzyme membrane anchor subunit [Eggerthella sinensis]|uniref:DMSO reductase n=1 Tax=Eggerthella sinensis TaxID=242230 RepID=A0A3N0IYJ4_9ACTN|nr:DmsC/YnfH family molybdoenzyme membrane anchor subunit [Eggerthella sinensis]RDB70720.1 hypothetical protein C1876_03140 [Eggerthella sinensis]RNM41480.1 hypothetical protein DMP09_09400 [Eggerthella sinensis]
MEVQWSLVFFAAFICWGAGTYLATVLFRELFKAPERVVGPAFVLSAVAVVIGAIASMTHLGHLDRIFGVLSNPGSGIFVEGLSSALLVMIVIVYLVAAARKASNGVLRVLAIVGVVPALVAAFSVGSSYLMAARPAWNVYALPLLSVATALSMGGVTALAINALTSGKAKDAAVELRIAKRMSASTVLLIAIHAATILVYVMTVAAAPFQDETRSATRMLAGDTAVLFWVAVVALGVIAPLIAALMQNRKSSVASASGEAVGRSSMGYLLAAAVACSVIAVIAFRVIMFTLGSSIINFGFTL